MTSYRCFCSLFESTYSSLAPDKSFTDNKPGSILDLHIYLPDVFPDNAEAHKLYSAHEAYDTYCTCPAGYCVAEQVVNDSPYNTDEAED